MGNSTHFQPDTASLIGGYPTSFDVVPSIIIGVGYSLGLLAFIYRQINFKTRAIVPLIHSVLFAIEHLIILFVRAAQAHTTVYTMNVFYTYWCQMTFAIGWINLIMAIVGFLRSVAINATLADEGRGSVDLPEERQKYRRFTGLLTLAFLLPIIIGIVGAGAHGTGVHASFVILCRYGSTVVALLLLGYFIFVLVGLKKKLAFIDHSALNILLYMSLILTIIPIYRLAVMYNTTPNLPGTATPDPNHPSSLSSNASKLLFYIFHLLPELVVDVWFHVMDVRATFNMSQWGDRARNDKKGIPRLLEKGQVVKGVGIEFTTSTKPSERLGPYQGGNGFGPQQDEEHAYASLLVPQERHSNDRSRRDPWA